MGRRRSKEKLSTGMALFLLIAGLLIGTVFTFGKSHWNDTIQREDAICVEATFDSHKVRYRRSRARGIDVYFTDYEAKYIDAACSTEELRADFKNLSQGDKVTVLVHPNSSTIWEIHTEEKVLLSFEDTQRILSAQTDGFFILGLFMYFCAAAAAVTLLVRLFKAIVGEF